jgi:GNAT superfamily N-acetyltransferase
LAPVVTTYLEMTSYEQFRPAYIEDPQLLIMPVGVPLPAFYRFLYGAVGKDYQWIDRNSWSDEYLYEYLAYYKGTPAGYIELQRQAEELGTEVAYFGLIPAFHGKGLGKHLLSFGVQRAWDEQPKRVWLHTCTLDGPYALRNYQQRGFTIYKQETGIEV